MGTIGLMRMLGASIGAGVAGLLHVVSGASARDRVHLKPGDAAPDFELPGSDGRVHRLRDFRNRERVVLAWFPKAFTGACTTECRSIGASRSALAGFKVRYFAASVDTPETNRRFAEAMGIDYPILSDPDRRVARAYGVLNRAGFASRRTFYIGEDGRILDVDTRVRARTHGDDVADRLEKLRTPHL